MPSAEVLKKIGDSGVGEADGFSDSATETGEEVSEGEVEIVGFGERVLSFLGVLEVSTHEDATIAKMPKRISTRCQLGSLIKLFQIWFKISTLANLHKISNSESWDCCTSTKCRIGSGSANSYLCSKGIIFTQLEE